MYNVLILWKKMNPDKQNIDHLSYRKLHIKEIIVFNAFSGQSQFTGSNPDSTKANLIRLTEWDFISQLPPTNNKARAQRKCIRCTKLGFRKGTHFWCAMYRVVLCLNECFEVYHTKGDITSHYIRIPVILIKSCYIFLLRFIVDALCKDFLMFYWYLFIC